MYGKNKKIDVDATWVSTFQHLLYGHTVTVTLYASKTLS